jgi:hypothetical protein
MCEQAERKTRKADHDGLVRGRYKQNTETFQIQLCLGKRWPYLRGASVHCLTFAEGLLALVVMHMDAVLQASSRAVDSDGLCCKEQ